MAAGQATLEKSGTQRLAVAACLMAVVVALCDPLTAVAETLPEVLAAAYRSNPRLDAERARQRATDEEVPRAQAGFRPIITGEADAGRSNVRTVPDTPGSGAASPYGYQIKVTQPVFKGFKTTNSVAVAEADVRAGRETLRQAEASLLLDAATVYMDVIRDQTVLKLREKNVEVLGREVAASIERQRAREVTLTDVAQARARRARAISTADLAKANLKISRANFERIVGHGPAGLVEPALSMKQLPESIEEAFRVAEQENPAIGGALYREAAARHAVDVVRGDLLPQVQVEASYGRHYDISTTTSEQEQASVTGRLTVPFYEGGEVQSRVRQAKHTHVSRLQEVEQARSETQAGVATAWSKLVAARAQLKSEQIQVEANKVALDGVREEERVGQRTLLDVLNAEQEYLDAQVAVANARHDVVVASFGVLQAIGRLTADGLAVVGEVYDAEQHYRDVRGQWGGTTIAEGEGVGEAVTPAPVLGRLSAEAQGLGHGVVAAAGEVGRATGGLVSETVEAMIRTGDRGDVADPDRYFRSVPVREDAYGGAVAGAAEAANSDVRRDAPAGKIAVRTNGRPRAAKERGAVRSNEVRPDLRRVQEGTPSQPVLRALTE